MKIIDKFLLRIFIAPFICSLFISIFVLLLEGIWIYMDDIIGKGANFSMITELFLYLSITTIPMALPIAVLFASVMVIGDLAEQKELSSMWSAGISLNRTFRPLLFAGILLAIFSCLSSSFITPKINSKFKSRLLKMKFAKPSLNFEEGLFNDDFQGYRIRIGKKHKNGTLEDIFIANHVGKNINQIIAPRGKLYNSSCKKFLIFDLRDGQQFQEPVTNAGDSLKKFQRTSFKKYRKFFSLEEFNIENDNQEYFLFSHKTLNSLRLLDAIQSKKQQIAKMEKVIIGLTNKHVAVTKKKYC